ncbi:hypothetical protein HCN44_005037 [Aphidius gifuensis]|uniref:Mitochondrial 2-oxoglutarate/malate carrier protein n=1 Tax=Aphidius gifuensis TaxID=684658 RepID=A0A834XUE8_APHGI|nr:mitochondrial 2-oxoglutarate/malate carrier protein-like [Aphidius gifuensis]KAF7992693.1 hypothetical protein HCN44_005037 [Aphidius gifuensis]
MSNKSSETSDSSSNEKTKALPTVINFINGGLSGMAATCIVHPMDVIKNQMQMSHGKASIGTTMSNIKSAGMSKFYSGLSAGLVRQATYTTGRLGIYNQLGDMWRSKNEGTPDFLTLAIMGAIAGSCGAFIGTPAEVALIRMTSDGRLPPDQRKNYKNVFNAFLRIIKEEGPTTLWRGSIATMGRATIVNMSQLATYSQAKIFFNTSGGIPDGIGLHFSASMLSGFLTAFNSMPFDIAKTRIQNSSSSSKSPTSISIIIKIAKTEGITALWKGFWPTYCRIGPHTVITFIFNEQFAEFYRKIIMK